LVQPLLATIVALFLSFLGAAALLWIVLSGHRAGHHHHQRPARQHV